MEKNSVKYIAIILIAMTLISLVAGVNLNKGITGKVTASSEPSVASEPTPNQPTQISNPSSSSSSSKPSEKTRNNNLDKAIVSEQDKNYFKEELNISRDKDVNSTVVKDFIQRKNLDLVNAEQIINIAKIVEEDKRTEASASLLVMRRDFVTKFEAYTKKNSENNKIAKHQIEKYLEHIEGKKKAKLFITQIKIKNFFKDKDSENFMRSIRSNL